jgi:AraC-like DNA-binding protein
MQRSTHSIDYQDIPRPVAVLADEYGANAFEPLHQHKRGELIFGDHGVMVVRTAGQSFIVPPQRALWIPPATPHEVTFKSPVSLLAIYIDTESAARLPSECRMIEVSGLLRELMKEATNLPVTYDLEGREGRVMGLILDEILMKHTRTFSVPMPQNPRLIRICQQVMADPSSAEALDRWASDAGMGRRTFTRAFRQETGMSFTAWCRDVRLMEAVSLLRKGQSVTTVAFDVGYNSSSAFTAMFRRAFGHPPTRYLTAGDKDMH